MATDIETKNENLELQVIHWSFDGIDEHIAVRVKMTGNWLTISRGLSIRKNVNNDENKITTSFVKFCYSINMPESIIINMNKVAWYDLNPTEDLVASYKKYLFEEPADPENTNTPAEDTPPPGLEQPKEGE